jgi:predicted DNA-binding ribbon-helix-helix protein
VQLGYAEGGVAMKPRSLVIKRSIVIGGHKTSVSLEDAFWAGLKEIAAKRDRTLSELASEVDDQRQHTNLSSALRLLVLDFYRSKDREPEAGEEMARTAATAPTEAIQRLRRTFSTVRVRKPFGIIQKNTSRAFTECSR